MTITSTNNATATQHPHSIPDTPGGQVFIRHTPEVWDLDFCLHYMLMGYLGSQGLFLHL